MTSVTRQTTIGGVSFTSTRALLAEGEVSRNKSIPVARAGVLTTRTDDDTGMLTLTIAGAAAAFTVGMRVDLYWDVGGVKGHRRGMLVSAQAGETITVGTAGGDIGAGDNLPIATSPIIIAASLLTEIRFDGDDVAVLAFAADARAIIVITGDDGVEDYFVHMPEAASSVIWDSKYGQVNPIAGDVITRAYMSQADITTAKNVKVGVAYN